MKRFLLSGIVALSTLTLNAQNVNIPDANFKAYLVGNTGINTNMDTEIQVSEATAFSGWISAVGLSITDLTGIEAFTALTGLSCDNNQLVSLNLSANTALTELTCSSNLLTSLNLSNNPSLTYLEAPSNQLTSFIGGTGLANVYLQNNPNLNNVDFSTCGSSITELNIGSCGFTTLDLNMHPNLSILFCQNNAINTLDLSSNSSMYNLNCSENGMTNLNLTGLTSLYNLNFFDNGLTSIDLTTCTGLKKLTGPQNQLTSLNLSNNTLLEEIYLYENGLVSISLPISTTLFKIVLANNVLTNLDASMCSALTFIVVNNNSLTSMNLANGNNSNVTYFHAATNPNLTCVQVDDVAYSTTNWTTIDAGASYSLDCNACIVNIPDANFKAYLVGHSGINTNSDTEIQCSEATAFTSQIWIQALGISDLTGLEAFTNLTSLNCNTNLLTSIDVSSNTALVILNIAGNSISSLDVSANTNLYDLFCDYNDITSIDLSNNLGLGKLNINNNLLTTLDLSSNNQLFQLGCETNELTTLNVKNTNNTNVTAFYVTGNPNLTCIEVDDVAYSTTNWTNIDAGASFSLDCGSSASINENTSIELTLFPNPASDLITVTSDAKIEEVSVFDTYGNLVNNFNSSTFSVSHLSAGVYFLTISTDQGVTQRKFIKE